MAKILDTQGVSSQLEGIIKNAKERLVIVSPYLQPSERIKRLLQTQGTKKKMSVTVIYREGELRPAVEEWLNTMPSLTTGSLLNLHAKCYLNENHALLTSMNLLESSQILSYEMGIVVSREEEPHLFDTIDQELRNLMRKSEIDFVAADQASTSDSSASNAQLEKGYCIQCAKTKPINSSQLVKPFCGPCFAKLKKSKGSGFPGKFCHTCGKEHSTSLSKPLCRDCYDKYKNDLVLAAN